MKKLHGKKKLRTANIDGKSKESLTQRLKTWASEHEPSVIAIILAVSLGIAAWGFHTIDKNSRPNLEAMRAFEEICKGYPKHDIDSCIRSDMARYFQHLDLGVDHKTAMDNTAHESIDWHNLRFGEHKEEGMTN